jgi:hypothetical protein
MLIGSFSSVKPLSFGQAHNINKQAPTFSGFGPQNTDNSYFPETHFPAHDRPFRTFSEGERCDCPRCSEPKLSEFEQLDQLGPPRDDNLPCAYIVKGEYDDIDFREKFLTRKDTRKRTNDYILQLHNLGPNAYEIIRRETEMKDVTEIVPKNLKFMVRIEPGRVIVYFDKDNRLGERMVLDRYNGLYRTKIDNELVEKFCDLLGYMKTKQNPQHLSLLT